MTPPHITYDAIILWIALNDRGARPEYRKLSDYYTLETVRMTAALFDLDLIRVAQDVVHVQVNMQRAMDEG